MAMTGSKHLVDPAWLEARLDDSSIRVIDCTLFMTPQPVGPSIVESGRSDWQAGHIPGSVYLHMVEDLSAPRDGLPYNLPPPEHITDLLASIGVNQDTRVVLYGAGFFNAITRAWWVLKASGVADVRILNGGWPRWTAENRPVSTGKTVFGRGNFQARRQAGRIAARIDVEAAIQDPDVVLINSLTPEQFHGTGGAHYGRPGRIPGSVNLPSRDLMESEPLLNKPLGTLEQMFKQSAVFEHEKVICYCGGGIAASNTAFVLDMLGHESVALYDQSLLEWSADRDLPMEVG